MSVARHTNDKDLREFRRFERLVEKKRRVLLEST